MLKSDGMYSNFWCGMTEEYYYLRTEDYKPILQRERVGCFHVPMVHSSVLVDLRRASSDGLTFVSSKVPDYKGPHDDIITFALAANKSGGYKVLRFNGFFRRIMCTNGTGFCTYFLLYFRCTAVYL